MQPAPFRSTVIEPPTGDAHKEFTALQNVPNIDGAASAPPTTTTIWHPQPAHFPNMIMQDGNIILCEKSGDADAAGSHIEVIEILSPPSHINGMHTKTRTHTDFE